MSEDQIQAACYQWLHNNYPSLRGLFFSVPNGSSRDIREAVKLKATGLVPGIPDCVLVWPVVVGFEFKTDIGKVSDVQGKIHSKWRLAGLTVHVVRSVDQFKSLIMDIWDNAILGNSPNLFV